MVETNKETYLMWNISTYNNYLSLENAYMEINSSCPSEKQFGQKT